MYILVIKIIEMGNNEDALFKCSLLNQEGIEVKQLFSQRYTKDKFFNWFSNSKTVIENESLPKFLSKSNSIASSIKIFYENLKDDELDSGRIDSEIDELFVYRQSHDLRFAFRGTDIPSIIIGRLNENLTVSYICDEGEVYFNLSSIAVS